MGLLKMTWICIFKKLYLNFNSWFLHPKSTYLLIPLFHKISPVFPCWFATVVMTKHHGLGGLSNRSTFSYNPVGQEVWAQSVSRVDFSRHALLGLQTANVLTESFLSVCLHLNVLFIARCKSYSVRAQPYKLISPLSCLWRLWLLMQLPLERLVVRNAACRVWVRLWFSSASNLLPLQLWNSTEGQMATALPVMRI